MRDKKQSSVEYRNRQSFRPQIKSLQNSLYFKKFYIHPEQSLHRYSEANIVVMNTASSSFVEAD